MSDLNQNPPANRLTTKLYWEEYYTKSYTDKTHIVNIAKEYDYFWQLLIDANQNKQPKDLVEIGGYPGRYLAYLANKYKLKPTSLDFNKDSENIHINMKTMEVDDYEILHQDFLLYQPQHQFDILLSIGFIEHFTNFNEVLDRHMLYVKPGSTLYINIPNMRNYIKWYKLLVDKKNLDIHHLECMDLEVFKNFAERNNLEIIHLNYYGGFPYSVHQKSNLAQRVIYEAHRFIAKRFLNKYLKKNPNKYFSSSIIGVFRVK